MPLKLEVCVCNDYSSTNMTYHRHIVTGWTRYHQSSPFQVGGMSVPPFIRILLPYDTTTSTTSSRRQSVSQTVSSCNNAISSDIRHFIRETNDARLFHHEAKGYRRTEGHGKMRQLLYPISQHPSFFIKAAGGARSLNKTINTAKFYDMSLRWFVKKCDSISADISHY